MFYINFVTLTLLVEVSSFIRQKALCTMILTSLTVNFLLVIMVYIKFVQLTELVEVSSFMCKIALVYKNFNIKNCTLCLLSRFTLTLFNLLNWWKNVVLCAK